MGLKGKAALTVCRTTSGSMVQVYANAPAPDDITAADAKRLVDEGYLVKVEDDAAPAKSTKVEDILAEVGDDKEKAAAALAEEKAGKNRKTLVDPLEALLAKQD